MILVLVIVWYVVAKSINKARWSEASLLRKRLFYAAIVVELFRGIFADAWERFINDSAFPAVFIVQMLLSGAGAIIITELLRAVISSGPTWTEQKHRWVLTSWWVGIFALQILGVLVGRGSFSFEQVL